jgi:hypothetical protein
MTANSLTTLYHNPGTNCVAQHFSSPMSSTAKKMAVAAAAVFFAAGTAALYTAFTHGAVILGGIALIGFTGLTIPTLGLYIAGAAFLALSLYFCARLLCAPDDPELLQALKTLERAMQRYEEFKTPGVKQDILSWISALSIGHRTDEILPKVIKEVKRQTGLTKEIDEQLEKMHALSQPAQKKGNINWGHLNRVWEDTLNAKNQLPPVVAQ